MLSRKEFQQGTRSNDRFEGRSVAAALALENYRAKSFPALQVRGNFDEHSHAPLLRAVVRARQGVVR
jgi:hypothetical protein